MKKFLDELHPAVAFLLAVMMEGFLLLIDSRHEYVRVVESVLWGWLAVNTIFLFMTTGIFTPKDEELFATLDGYIYMSRWVSIWLIVASTVTFVVALYLR